MSDPMNEDEILRYAGFNWAADRIKELEAELKKAKAESEMWEERCEFFR